MCACGVCVCVWCVSGVCACVCACGVCVVCVCVHVCACVCSQGNNRTLLSWLKLWDEIVFGKSSVLNKSPTGYNTKTKSNQLKNGKKPFVNRFEYQDPKTFNNRDVSVVLSVALPSVQTVHCMYSIDMCCEL